MEPGFAFLSSSRGCAPFTVRIETLYLAATPGTQYYVDWGDGSPQEIYVQANATGVVIQHTYPNSPVDCGYDLTIDAENACNPLGSVVQIQTQVVVWTNDVVAIDPVVYRVCQGTATTIQFTDNSDWNCFPRATRENNEPRWIQWIYGVGPAANRIPGITIDGVTPGVYPYSDPLPTKNPIYPVLAPGQTSLPISVPATTPADIGKEFVIQLKNWNQCNPYDLNLTDGNPRNPVNGDLVNGDMPPQTTTARIRIVDSPQPDFETRLGNAGGPIQSVFCVGDAIYFDNNTPPIAGASFDYTWQFYDNPTGAGAPLATRTQTNPTFAYTSSGQKLIRLTVRDGNAAGNCEQFIEKVITVSPSLVAQIGVTDLSGVTLTPDFCQEANAPLTTFDVRFHDVSVGIATPSTEWRWEFYDENNTLVREEPSGGFSSTILGPFDDAFVTPGSYRVRLVIRDNVTFCETTDEVFVRVFEKPVPDFSFSQVCEGNGTAFSDLSTLNATFGEQIVLWEWDMSYDGVTFNKDPSLDNQQNFSYTFPADGNFDVALRVTTDIGTCSDLIVKTVTVDPVPVSAFTPDVLSGCSELTVTFTNNSVLGQPDDISEFRWEIDGGSGFAVDSVQHPGDPGFSGLYTRVFTNTTLSDKVYDVRLRTVTVNGCETVSSVSSITVFPGPSSGFISANYNPFDDNCSPLSVQFNVDAETQSLSPTDYTWIVSDISGVLSTVSTGVTPTYTHEFNNGTLAIRNYNVTLRATLSSGCFGDSTRVIRVSPVPVSAFSADTLVFDCNQMQVMYEADQKGLSTYDWRVYINGVLTQSVIGSDDDLMVTVNRVTADQNLRVELVTQNFAGCTAPQSGIDITVPAYDDIGAAFDVSPVTQVFPNSTVSITNNTNPGPWAFEWDFGDGTTSNDPAVSSHTYATFGTYTIRLTVENNVCIETQARTITIEPIPPVLEFTYDPASGCVPLTVNFTNLSLYADPTTYYWEFGTNQGTSRAVNPSYTYTEPGLYSVTLSATNVLGETVVLTKQFIIEVYDRPIARFDVKPRTVTIPGGILYTRNQSLGATSYEWDFGDGSVSTEYEPEHVYTEEGVFDISLTAYGPEGCADTMLMQAGVRVESSGKVLVPNAFSPNLSGPGSNGKNDVFIPLMRGITEFHMLIFNRWGEILFETTNPEVGWDGYYKGRLCQQDVYIYKLTAKDEDGNLITRVGDVHLIR